MVVDDQDKSGEWDRDSVFPGKRVGKILKMTMVGETRKRESEVIRR